MSARRVPDTPDLLVVVHSVARIDAENVPARLRAGPIEIPVIVGRHLSPAALLKVVEQHGLVHVRAEANLHALILVVRYSLRRKQQGEEKKVITIRMRRLSRVVNVRAEDFCALPSVHRRQTRRSRAFTVIVSHFTALGGRENLDFLRTSNRGKLNKTTNFPWLPW